MSLLDELDGKPIQPSHWAGFDPRVYNARVKDDGILIEKLCARLQDLDVSKYSLEMQMWWRDHKEADHVRLKAEIAATKNEAERKTALAKLTSYERKLLGLP